MIRTLLRTGTLLLLLGAISLQAQTWEALRELKPGDTVKVRETTGEEYKGTLSSVSADAVVIKTRKAEISVERARVRKVEVKSGSRRLRNAVIGAAVGVAIGVVVDQTFGRYLHNETSENGRPATYIVPIALFGGIGAALPAYRTVYRVR